MNICIILHTYIFICIIGYIAFKILCFQGSLRLFCLMTFMLMVFMLIQQFSQLTVIKHEYWNLRVLVNTEMFMYYVYKIETWGSLYIIINTFIFYKLLLLITGLDQIDISGFALRLSPWALLMKNVSKV